LRFPGAVAVEIVQSEEGGRVEVCCVMFLYKNTLAHLPLFVFFLSFGHLALNGWVCMKKGGHTGHMFRHPAGIRIDNRFLPVALAVVAVRVGCAG
jgi:hypothetical protein